MTKKEIIEKIKDIKSNILDWKHEKIEHAHWALNQELNKGDNIDFGYIACIAIDADNAIEAEKVMDEIINSK